VGRLDDALGDLEHAVWSWWRRRSAPVQGILLALLLLLVFVIQAIRS
jgi:hypothetical protein